MGLKYAERGLALQPRGDVDEPKNPVMGKPMDDCQLAEVLVERDDNAAFAVRQLQNRRVARIVAQITRPKYIMACCE